MDDCYDQFVPFDDENTAKGELVWLQNHNNMREYKLVARMPKLPHVDLLDDEIPWM